MESLLAASLACYQGWDKFAVYFFLIGKMRGLDEVPFNVPASSDSYIRVMKCVTLLLFQEEEKKLA